VLNTVPSNATQLQDIVRNNSDNSPTQGELNSTYNNATTTNSSVNNMPSKPQDLIPVVVNMTQNTNATDIPFSNVLNTVPSNATQLQDIVRNNSDNSPTQGELNSTYNNATTTNSSVNNMPSKPQDLIPVVVNMTQNTNATDLGFMQVINSTPSLERLNVTNTNN
jgi:septation ring formation regulator EzrA